MFIAAMPACVLDAHNDNQQNNTIDGDAGAPADADPKAPDANQDGTCGNGVIEADEVCDDGANNGGYDFCAADCQGPGPHCGDGITQSGKGEECDDGNANNGDTCSNTCKLNAVQKLVFVSSATYTGKLGGLAGADAKCQALATAAGHAGTYKAWLSDGIDAPINRFTQASVPYVLVNGSKIADNWADLVNGDIAASISLTEKGDPAPNSTVACVGSGKYVWSAVKTSGDPMGVELTCAGWTSEGAGDSSAWGDSELTNTSWSFHCNGGTCGWQAALYCFQQ